MFLSTAIFLPSHDWGMGNWRGRPQKSFVIPIVAAFKGSPSSDVTLCSAMWQRGDCARALFIAGLNQRFVTTVRNVAKIFLCSKIVVGQKYFSVLCSFLLQLTISRSWIEHLLSIWSLPINSSQASRPSSFQGEVISYFEVSASWSYSLLSHCMLLYFI